VGVNSFNRVPEATNNDNHYHYPHVVFQFKDIPVTRPMNSSNTNAGGYPATAMRTYLTGDFFTGLKNAGVPAEVVWAPTRTVSTQYNTAATTTIADSLWLPTEREMFGAQSRSPSGETAENQAWLEYYATNAKPVKNYNGNDYWYWLASPSAAVALSFCNVLSYGNTNYYYAGDAGGCAPAFCVR
jgi:hypothetical protein